MQPFADFRTFSGLSFVAQKGQLQYLKTLQQNNLKKFLSDVKSLNVEDYDLILTDFEPVTAWAARLKKIPSVGLSHQNAFRYKVPVKGKNPLSSAPAEQNQAFHWHHFNQPILPPMINTNLKVTTPDADKILVYLPFLDQKQYYDIFHRFPEFNFVQYHDVTEAETRANITCRPLSQDNFQRDFIDCSGIICSAGFGLCSEAIHYRKKLMVIPLKGQMEQLSNALALQDLGYANSVIRDILTRKTLSKWLHEELPQSLWFPNVAHDVTRWIAEGRVQSIHHLSKDIWAKVKTNDCYQSRLPPWPELKLNRSYRVN